MSDDLSIKLSVDLSDLDSGLGVATDAASDAANAIDESFAQSSEAVAKMIRSVGELGNELQSGNQLDISKFSAALDADAKKLGDFGNKVQFGPIVDAAGQAAQQMAAYAQQLARDEEEIDRERLASSTRVARMELQAQKEALDGEVAAGQITNAQKLSQLRDLVEQEDELNIHNLVDSIANYDGDIVGFNKVCDQIREAREKLSLDLAAIDRQIAADSEKTANEDAKRWDAGNREILSSEDTLVRDLLTKRQSLGRDLLQVSGQLIEKELEADLNYWTERALLSIEGAQKEELTEKGGVLMNLLLNTQKTAQTTAAQAAQTGAVVAGATARTTAEKAGGAAATAAQAVSGSASILNDAYIAAAGTYAAVAQIPVIGPFLAPEAAAVAFAAVMAFDSLTSMDVGAWNLPHDMPAMLHKGEMVVPQNFASGLRANASAAGNDGVTFNTHYYPTINMREPASLKDMLQGSGAEMFGAIQRGYRTGLPMRPSMRTV